MEKLFTINENRCSIRCRLESSRPRGFDSVVICCHGFAGRKTSSSTLKLAKRLTELDDSVAVLSFDLPCHGDDASPVLSLERCDAYIGSVIAYAREKLGAKTLYANGISFGGYLLLKYISEHGSPFERISLRSPAVPMYSVLTSHVMTEENRELLSKTGACEVGFADKVRITPTLTEGLAAADITKRDFSQYRDRLLLIHGTEDEIVPYDAVEAFAEKNGLRLITVPGADHRFTSPEHMALAIKKATEHLK